MGNKSKVNILVKNTTWIYVSKIAIQILSFVINVLVIRKLSVDVFGTYSFLKSSFIIISIFSVAPVTSVFNRFIPEYEAKNNFNKLIDFIKKGIFIGVLIFITILSLIIIFKEQFSTFFKINNFQEYLIPFIILIFFAFMKQMTDNVNKSLLLHKQTSLIAIFTTVVNLVLLVLFLPRLNVIVLLNITSVTSALYFFLTLFVLIKHLKLKLTVDIEQNEYSNKTEHIIEKKRIFRYGFFSSLNELGSGIVGKTSDIFIVGALSSQYYVGLYAFALKIYNLLYKILPLKDFLTVLRPLFIQKFSKDFNEKEFHTIYNFIVKIMLPVYFIPSVYFLIFGGKFIDLIYTSKYSEAYWPMNILLMGNITVAFFYPLGLSIILKEKMEIPFMSKIVVIFSIIAGIYGMKFYGIIAVALVTLTGDLLRNFFMYFMFRRYVKIKYKLKDLLNYVLIIVALFLLFGFSAKYISNIVLLGLVSVLFALTTLWLLVFFHPFDEDEVIYLNKIGNSTKLTRIFSKVIRKMFTVKIYLYSMVNIK